MFEKDIFVDGNSNYRLLLNGGGVDDYFVSDFLLRPETTNVIIKIDTKNNLINNHPFIME